MNRHLQSMGSAVALAVLAPTLVLASAQARGAGPEVTDQAGVAAAAIPVTHTVYVARPTNVGASSMSDHDVLATLGEVTAYWKDEADGRIADFVLPASTQDDTRFATFETSVEAGVVCGFGDFDNLAAEAGAKFQGANFDPYEGGTDLLVVVTPNQGCASSTVGYAPVGPGFHTGGVVMSRSTPALRSSLAHEMGHTFGFGHSNIGADTYRNLYNVMSLSIADATLNQLTALSTAYRVGSGVNADGEVKTVAISNPHQSVTVTETLRPRSEEAGLRGLALTPPDTRKTFYVDYRSGTGQDAGSPYANGRSSGGFTFGPGVVVEETQTTANGVEVSLLPARLKTDTQLGHAATGAGETWTSPSGTVSVSVVSMSPQDGAKVTVTYTPPEPFSGGQVVVSGQPTFGSELHAQHSGFTPSPTEVEWQWLRNGSAILNATGSSYAPTAADVDQQLSVRGTAYKPGVLPTSVISASVMVQPRAWTWTIPPHLSVSSPQAGQSVSVEYGYLGDPAVEMIQWYVDGQAINGATGNTFVPAAWHLRQKLTATVTLQAPGWTSVSLTTEASAPVADPDPDPDPDPSPGPSPSTPTPTPTPTPTATPTPTTPPSAPGALSGPTPTIKGKAVVGSRLRAMTGSWPVGTRFTYRWLANGKVVRKATSATLTVKPALEGKKLSVRVTAAKPGYTSVTLVSARTKRVTD